MKKLRSTHFSLPESEVTPESIYLNRRHLLKASFALSALSVLPQAQAKADLHPLEFKASTDTLPLTPESKVTSYNNFYEFGTGKDDPVAKAQALKTTPWQLSISGEAEVTGSFQLEDILKWNPLEERIYRLRCVEAWSMVIPWIGFPLATLLQRFKPTSKANYVAFETLFDPAQMPGQRSLWSGGGIDYPYVEGLTLAEAMNPLTLMAVGLYGKTLPPQNGAPIRLVVPWKYGFKSIKSIVSIRFTEKRPKTTWSQLAPAEYGFFANVNPDVAHPRWSQASERVIGAGGLFGQTRRNTELYNGYANEVAHLYSQLNERHFF